MPNGSDDRVMLVWGTNFPTFWKVHRGRTRTQTGIIYGENGILVIGGISFTSLYLSYKLHSYATVAGAVDIAVVGRIEITLEHPSQHFTTVGWSDVVEDRSGTPWQDSSSIEVCIRYNFAIFILLVL